MYKASVEGRATWTPPTPRYIHAKWGELPSRASVGLGELQHRRLSTFSGYRHRAHTVLLECCCHAELGVPLLLRVRGIAAWPSRHVHAGEDPIVLERGHMMLFAAPPAVLLPFWNRAWGVLAGCLLSARAISEAANISRIGSKPDGSTFSGKRWVSDAESTKATTAFTLHPGAFDTRIFLGEWKTKGKVWMSLLSAAVGVMRADDEVGGRRCAQCPHTPCLKYNTSSGTCKKYYRRRRG